jgi:prepilin-type N-terminal cleavage/methylation domain-containing protein
MIRRGHAGFTLVELIIVVVIIGLFATVAIPKFSSSRDKALVAAMKSDLRNLVTQQESRLADSGSYVTSFPPTIWSPSTGVTGPTIALTPTGWTARWATRRPPGSARSSSDRLAGARHQGGRADLYLSPASVA